ncbi:MAG: hypothetical protein HQL41_17560, partial [Alphaproteobacteria bacterium]|nr:hypothetical protein [Alphaproteobacteria bacterium]
MGTLKIAVTHFEVYVYERDRWVLHARYTRAEREAAVTEAKMIERALNVGVKVVREEYNPHDNDSSETTVYLSSKLAHLAQKKAAQTPQRGQTYDGALGEDDEPFVSRRQAGPAPAAMGAVLKLTIIILAALGLAAFATAAASGLTTQAGFAISRDLYPKLMFAVFVLTFLITALPLAMTYVRLDLPSGPRRAAQVAPPAPVRRVR